MTINLLAIKPADHRVTTDLSVYSGGSLPTISSTFAYTGTYSYRCNVKGAFGHAEASGISAWRVSFWARLADLDINNLANLFAFSNGLNLNSNTTSYIRCAVGSSIGNLVVRRPLAAATFETLATSSSYPTEFGTTGTWFHCGCCFKCHATDGFFVVYVNGVEYLNLTGDTRLSYWNGSSQVFETSALYSLIVGGVGGSTNWDDIYVDDLLFESYVGEAAAPVPARRFYPLFPNGVGSDADFTPLSSTNLSNIDDNPNDGDTSYNKALAANLRDTFNFDSITLPADHQIVSVIPMVFAKRLDSGIASQLSVHAYDGVTYGESADLDLPMDYQKPVMARLALQPDGSAWNETDVGGCEYGYTSAGTF